MKMHRTFFSAGNFSLCKHSKKLCAPKRPVILGVMSQNQMNKIAATILVFLLSRNGYASCSLPIEEDLVDFVVSEIEGAPSLNNLIIKHPKEIDGWPLGTIMLSYRKNDIILETALESREVNGEQLAFIGFSSTETSYIKVRVTYKSPNNECIKYATYSASSK